MAITLTAPTKPSWATLTDDTDGTGDLSGTAPGSPETAPTVILATNAGGYYDQQGFSIVVSAAAARGLVNEYLDDLIAELVKSLS